MFSTNLNLTSQDATQSQGGGGGVQVAAQDASNHQWADADATAFQFKPSNTNAPVSIGGGHGKKHECGCEDGHGGGSGGDVTQTNLAGAAGIALNANLLDQSAEQSQGSRDAKCGCYGKGGGRQVIAQSARNKQDADASANAFQLWAANDNSPVRIGSAGSGGSVTQTNAALAFSLAANLNRLNQEATQTQS